MIARLIVAWMLLALVPAFATDLVELQARIAPATVLRGAFEQEKTVEGFSLPLHSQGRFVVARDRGVIWNTQQPFPSRMVIGASGLRLDDQSATAMPGEALARVNRLLVALIGGDLAQLQQEFEVSPNFESEGRWTLQLQARDPQLASRLQGLVVSGARWVEQVEFADEHANRTRLRFSGQEADTTLSPDEVKALD